MTRGDPSPLLAALPEHPVDHPPGLGEDSGPHPAMRAVAGLLVGAAAGAAAAALIPRTGGAGPRVGGRPS